MQPRHRVVIIGGGFGGLYAARSLKCAPVSVSLVDRRNFHLFQPLLYQVATGGLSPANIAAPLRSILKRQKNVEVLLAEVTQIDCANRRVILIDGELEYDTLIVAAGASHSYFGHDEWEPLAPGLKTIEDATEIRRRILLAFENAEREVDPVLRHAWMTFVVVGAGPTGCELAGAISEIARHTLKHDFRNINPPDALLILVEAQDRVLGPYPPELSAKAAESLSRLGVTVRTGTSIAEIHPDRVVLLSGGKSELVPTHTVIWAAGVRASPLSKLLATATGASLDRAGRITVEPDMTLAGYPDIFVIGDMAEFSHQNGKPLPGLAPVAVQQGRYAAEVIARRLTGKPPQGRFHYKDHGTISAIGRWSAIAQIGRWKLSGVLAWWVWLLVHIMELVQFENRLLVLIQWSWNYFTFNRSARLITGRNDRHEHSDRPLHPGETGGERSRSRR